MTLTRWSRRLAERSQPEDAVPVRVKVGEADEMGRLWLWPTDFEHEYACRDDFFANQDYYFRMLMLLLLLLTTSAWWAQVQARLALSLGLGWTGRRCLSVDTKGV